MEDNSEDENIGASPDTEPERGGSSPEIETSPENKRLNLEKKKVDRISDLPDCLIQHILSFLPSTKEAIRTGILSKRWKNQWSRVPVLIFYSTAFGKDFQPKSQHLMECLAMRILGQIQHVKLLEMGSLFIKLVSALEWAVRSA
ncbi:F-box family protein [Euphorbia peplus]|nr:F-box family protein [Euphorbia peplus]